MISITTNVQTEPLIEVHQLRQLKQGDWFTFTQFGDSTNKHTQAQFTKDIETYNCGIVLEQTAGGGHVRAMMFSKSTGTPMGIVAYDHNVKVYKLFHKSLNLQAQFS